MISKIRSFFKGNTPLYHEISDCQFLGVRVQSQADDISTLGARLDAQIELISNHARMINARDAKFDAIHNEISAIKDNQVAMQLAQQELKIKKSLDKRSSNVLFNHNQMRSIESKIKRLGKSLDKGSTVHSAFVSMHDALNTIFTMYKANMDKQSSNKAGSKPAIKTAVEAIKGMKPKALPKLPVIKGLPNKEPVKGKLAPKPASNKSTKGI